MEQCQELGAILGEDGVPAGVLKRKTDGLHMDRLRRPGPCRPNLNTGLHVWTHRFLPSSARAPINSLSPSLFSFSFPAHALRKQPIVSWISYGSLVAVSVYHVLAGVRKITSKGTAKVARLPSLGWQGSYAGLVGGLGLGLVRLQVDSKTIPYFLAVRYDSLLAKMPV